MSRSSQTWIIVCAIMAGASFVAPTETKQTTAFFLSVFGGGIAFLSFLKDCTTRTQGDK